MSKVPPIPPSMNLITMRPRRHVEINVTVSASELMDLTEETLVKLEQSVRRLESALSTEDKT